MDHLFTYDKGNAQWVSEDKSKTFKIDPLNPDRFLFGDGTVGVFQPDIPVWNIQGNFPIFDGVYVDDQGGGHGVGSGNKIPYQPLYTGWFTTGNIEFFPDIPAYQFHDGGDNRRFRVSANVESGEGGIIGGGWYKPGDVVTVTPSPNTMYSLTSWDRDGNAIATPSYTFTMPSAHVVFNLRFNLAIVEVFFRIVQAEITTALQQTVGNELIIDGNSIIFNGATVNAMVYPGNHNVQINMNGVPSAYGNFYLPGE